MLKGYLSAWAQRLKVRTWAYELGLTVVLVIVSLRGFLFSPGYYVYSDQFWSILPSLPNSESFVLLAESGRVSPSYFFLFTRGLVTFPSLLLSSLGLPYLTWMRIYIALSFAILLGVAWIGAEVVIRLYENNSQRQFSIVSRELAKTFFVIALFSNAFMIQVVGDGGQFADSLILVGFVVGLVLLIYSDKPIIAVIIGCYLSVVLLLDPDYYALVLVGFVLIALASSIKSRSISRLKWFSIGVMISLPILTYVLIGIQITLAPTAIGNLYRPFSSSPLGLSNMNVSSAILLYGYGWPFVTLAPPSSQLFSSSLVSLPTIGRPADLILIYSPIGYLWLASLAILPCVLLAGLAIRRLRGALSTLLVVLAAGVLLALYPHIPPLLFSLEWLASLPYFGYAIGTSFAVQDHTLMLVAGGYVAGASLVVSELLSRPSNLPAGQLQPTRGSEVNEDRGHPAPALRSRFSLVRCRRRGILRYAAVWMVFALVILSGWQAYNGTFYPGRADYSNFTGNGLIPIGAYTPFEISNTSLMAYNYIFHSGSNFNVYWPIGAGIEMAGYTARLPSVSLPGLPYLIASNLSADVAPYLTSHSVLYVVVQAGPSPLQIYVPSPQAAKDPFSYYFGEPTYGLTVDAFARCQFLSLVFSEPNITIFKNLQYGGLTYPASLLLSSSSEAGLNASLYGAFRALGINATLTGSAGYGQTVSINSPKATSEVEVTTPLELLNATINNESTLERETRNLTTAMGQISNGVTYSANSSSLGTLPEWNQSQAASQFNYNLSGFVFSNWAGNYSASVTKGNILVNASQSTTFTLNFGGPATNTVNGVQLKSGAPSGTYVSLKAEISTSQPLNSTLYSALSVVGESGPLSFTQVNVPASTSNPITISEHSLLPLDSNAFTFRLGGTFKGQLQIEYYNISLLRLPIESDPGLPFGSFIGLNGTNRLPSEAYQGAMILAAGKGEIDGVAVESSGFIPVVLSGGESLVTTGNLSIAEVIELSRSSLGPLLGNYAVYNGAFSDAVYMCTTLGSCISPISTVYGTNLYVLTSNQQFHLEYSKSLILLEAAYPAVIGYILVFALAGRRLGRRRHLASAKWLLLHK
jgi:hypothetical protein